LIPSIRSFFFIILTLWLNVATAFEVPALQGPVMDQVGLLSRPLAYSLSQQLHQANNQGVAQVQILIIQSLQGESIEQAAIQIFDQWKLGDAKKDNGVLILAAIQDRKMRIEVGQGLEGSIPDVIAKRIINEIMRPLFKSGNFDAGFKYAVQAVFEAAATETNGQVFNVESFKEKIISDPQAQDLNSKDVNYLQSSQAEKQSGRGKIPMLYIVIFLAGLWFVIFLFSPSTAIWILLNLLSGGGRGGGGGHGNWSGGGGSSSGGGASGDW